MCQLTMDVAARCRPLLFAIPVLWFVCVAPRAQAQCGKERWDIKDLNDAHAKKVNFTPVVRTVAQLLQLPVVVPTRNEARRSDERTTYRVHCELVRYKLETDGDVHMVIRDVHDPSAHMIAEIPDPTCPDALAGGHAAEFQKARDALIKIVKKHPPLPRMQSIHPPPKIEIVGVGFYDPPHGQSGMAPNDLELHPVIELKPAP